MAESLETKFLPLSAAGIKADAESRTFTGYASTFGGEPDLVGDVIERGAFAETLARRDRPVRMLLNHDGLPIGRWLELAEDERGLRVKGQLTPGHSLAEDTFASLQHGALDALSIGYRIAPDGAEWRNDVRLLKRLELVEVSIVAEPANPRATVTDVSAKSSPRALEAALREALGLSRREAKKLVAGGWPALNDDTDDEIAAVAAELRELTHLLRGAN